MNVPNAVDILISGSGPAGSVAAAKLATSGLQVLLVEKTAFDTQRLGEFLSPRARAAVSRLGLLDSGWEHEHRSINEFLSTWGSPHPAVHNYIFDPYGHGLVLNRVKFDRDLAESAVTRGAKLLTRSRVRKAERKQNGWTVLIDQGGEEHSVTCSFLLVCSGRAGSPIRGLEFGRQREHRLFCSVLRVPGFSSDGTPATETFSDGWTYSVGLASGELVINMFTRNGPKFLDPRPLSLKAFLHELAYCSIATSRLLSAKIAHSADVVFFVSDASSILSRPAVGHGWCLLGDSAQSLDPLSSWGIHQACQHAMLVSGAICDSRAVVDTDLSKYEAYLEQSYAAYIAARRHVYNLEQRWTTPFWRCDRLDSYTR